MEGRGPASPDPEKQGNHATEVFKVSVLSEAFFRETEKIVIVLKASTAAVEVI